LKKTGAADARDERRMRVLIETEAGAAAAALDA